MGLGTPDSLALEYASAMTLTTTTTESPTHLSSSLWKVFSIPELIEPIAKYLNTSQLLKLGLVSKTFSHIFQYQLSLTLFAGAFHDQPYGPLGINPILPDAFRRLAPRVGALTLDLLCFRDKPQNAMLKTVYEYSAVPLRRLRITYWGEELGVLEELLTRLPNLTDFSVTFKSSSNATAVAMMLTRVGKTRQAVAAVGNGNAHGSSLQQGGGGGLQSLVIELDIPEVKAINMADLSELVEVWPALTSLKLACISLKVNDPAQLQPTTTGVLPPPPPPPPGLTAAAVAAATTTTASLPLPTIPPSDSTGTLEEPSFPRMESLALTGCPLEPLSLRALDRLFPNLQELELDSCPGGWYRTLAGIRTSQNEPNSDLTYTSDVPLVHLRKLSILFRHQSSRNKILGIVKHRPFLTCIKTDMLPDTRDELLEVAAFCSGVEVSELVAAPDPPSFLPTAVVADSTLTASAGMNEGVDAGVNVGATSTSSSTAPTDVGTSGGADARTTMKDMSRVRNRIKRLSIQTYASPPRAMDVIEKFYNAPAFRHLEYVYMQNWELSMKLFPFAKTLRELNLGGAESRLQDDELVTLNLILHQLPVLEDLKLQRCVDGAAMFKLFKGFGREPLSQDESQQGQVHGRPAIKAISHGQADGLSYLRKMWLLYKELDNNDNRRLSLDGLKTAVLDRFMFLEKLKIQAWLEADLPPTEEVFLWQKKVLLAEAAMGGEREEGKASSSLVTKCRVEFNSRSQTIVSVVL
ncbi:hypothetical protein KI688_001783 [Linnemannia hyalina]|uniref:F-box domain-containing protein n=1 Tax=Linnemannia hyalina TaxID=64524 RepID=A0A9P7XQJ3_9FUNG|nr:hypothetical protein KI688_001783 [Linnemannia hyalina]